MARKKKKANKQGELRQRAIQVRIYPTEDQAVLINKTFGCCRFIWNNMLGDEGKFYLETDEHFVPTPAKYKAEFSFLKEVDSLALANVQLALNRSFAQFFRTVSILDIRIFGPRKKARSLILRIVNITKPGKRFNWSIRVSGFPKWVSSKQRSIGNRCLGGS